MGRKVLPPADLRPLGGKLFFCGGEEISIPETRPIRKSYISIYALVSVIEMSILYSSYSKNDVKYFSTILNFITLFITTSHYGLDLFYGNVFWRIFVFFFSGLNKSDMISLWNALIMYRTSLMIFIKRWPEINLPKHF